MKKNTLNIEEFGLNELSHKEAMRIQGGIPWFLIGFASGFIYYLLTK